MTSVTELYKLYLQHPVVITDSRKIESGCIFFALRGPNFNGNIYAKDALQKGASYAVVDEVDFAKEENCLLVDDCLLMLQNLATHHRRQFTIPILAITGSNGKTTTKELVHVVLSSQYKTHSTVGNFNNHIGVPLTILRMPLNTEIAIIEMGANHVGEIDFLSRIALPTHGLITNIGKAHLEGFKNLEGVKKGKSELYKHLQSTGGMVFVNQDEKYLVELAKPNQNKLLYGNSDRFSIEDIGQVNLITSQPFVKATFLDQQSGKNTGIDSHLMGLYNFNNIMTAIVLGRYFKVPSIKIKWAIENYKSTNNRSQLVEKESNTYLLDAYNANPDSMIRAMAYFATMPAVDRFVILGDMLELGEFSETEHTKIVDIALEEKFTGIWLVGSAFAKTPQKAENIFRFENISMLKEWYKEHIKSDSHFLLKGSRGIKLESFLDNNLI